MSAALVYLSIGAGLTIGVGFLTVAVLFFKRHDATSTWPKNASSYYKRVRSSCSRSCSGKAAPSRRPGSGKRSDASGFPRWSGIPSVDSRTKCPLAAGRRKNRTWRPREAKRGHTGRIESRGRRARQIRPQRRRGPKRVRRSSGSRCRILTTTCRGAAGTSPQQSSSRSATTGPRALRGLRPARRAHPRYARRSRYGGAGGQLRRAYDAIDRTTQRLDMLEEHYPELATDTDRISSRIGTARLHASLAERFGHSN